ncbi:hypothetical protein ACKLNO_11205 [Neisseriaceae bacterium B1]
MLKKAFIIATCTLALTACDNSYTAVSANNSGVGAAIGTGLRW